MNISDLKQRRVDGGNTISAVLDELARHPAESSGIGIRDLVAGGTAFVTFAYDIDGVTNEVAKYARCIESLVPGAPIHCVAGTFGPKADIILDPSWHRRKLDRADGWDKWDDGKWFSRLFYHDLIPGTPESSELAAEMWSQALVLAEELVDYIEHHSIGLLITINVNSNPGNLAFALAVVLATEVTGCAVISNNHDFFWEGGMAACKRNAGQEPGPRDHFFRNHDNPEFFNFFQRIFPWNGRRWVQANINQLQSRRLIDRFHFRPDRVFTIGTALDPEFFVPASHEKRMANRERMARVLGGTPVIEPMSVTTLHNGLSAWMADQRPVVLGAHEDLMLDVTAEGSLYILQPTRVVPRKQIWRDWELIGALLRHQPFRDAFEERPDLTLTLHVSGPVPIEHRDAMERVLESYEAVLAAAPPSIAARLFLAFSAGWQTHPSIDGDVDIVDIFQLADLVTLPSSTEGRGLPIPESAAAGVPLICTEYEPKAVFEEVIGAGLPPEQRILYDRFPPGDFTTELLDSITTALLEPKRIEDRRAHNRCAVRDRFSFEALVRSFEEIFDHFDSGLGGR